MLTYVSLICVIETLEAIQILLLLDFGISGSITSNNRAMCLGFTASRRLAFFKYADQCEILRRFGPNFVAACKRN